MSEGTSDEAEQLPCFLPSLVLSVGKVESNQDVLELCWQVFFFFFFGSAGLERMAMEQYVTMTGKKNR